MATEKINQVPTGEPKSKLILTSSHSLIGSCIVMLTQLVT
jgi:hypothetical protein